MTNSLFKFLLISISFVACKESEPNFDGVYAFFENGHYSELEYYKGKVYQKLSVSPNLSSYSFTKSGVYIIDSNKLYIKWDGLPKFNNGVAFKYSKKQRLLQLIDPNSGEIYEPKRIKNLDYTIGELVAQKISMKDDKWIHHMKTFYERKCDFLVDASYLSQKDALALKDSLINIELGLFRFMNRDRITAK
jgi:hypothetical protein